MEWSNKRTTPQKSQMCPSSPVVNFLKKTGHIQLQQATPTTPIFGRKQSMCMFPIVRTPDAGNKFHKIKNPFEATMADRLHLPTICSPSLFQRPNTPQHSSTQFEWTIEEMSSLGPANVEPHETQFMNSPNPEKEAKAQAAIRSFFKEQHIVPSPMVDNKFLSSTVSQSLGPSQVKRITLAEISGNTPLSKPGRRIRDSSAQTMLSLPPVLPPEIEEALRPYFSYLDNQQVISMKSCYDDNVAEYEAKDASLRRKLFQPDESMEEPVIHEYDHFSPPPKSPEMDVKPFHDSLDKSSFGSLSPISKLDDSISPVRKDGKENKTTNVMDSGASGKRKSSFLNSSFSNENNTPTVSSVRMFPKSFRTGKSHDYSSEGTPGTFIHDSLHRTTPGVFTNRRSSSPAFGGGDSSIGDSIHRKVSQLVVNSAKRQKAEIMDLFDEESEDEMHVSEFSFLESPGKSRSAGHIDTPRGGKQKRKVRAINLSQSFTLRSDDDQDNSEDEVVVLSANNINKDEHIEDINQKMRPTSNFYRTDSGFNELTQSSTASTQDTVDFNRF